ncbi:MAG: hypothetical protein LQ350_004823 [Teloschistes chrysophthalmus]|nr:MAG: hypothetical protein LQ350_004823 [Niorma chrysophthalma]
MIPCSRLLSFLAIFSLWTSALVNAQDVPYISIKGSKFFHANGCQFFLKDVVYQQVPDNDEQGSISANFARSSVDNLYVDPLSDASACQRDITYFKRLNVNVVRSYGIDNTKSHDDYLNLLAKAGIYALIDLPAPGLTIASRNPTWNDVLYDRFTSVVDVMHTYPNLLGFVVGDNVVAGVGETDSGPYVKAAVRDIKAYMRQKEYRPIPIGYVNDVLQGNAAAIDSQSKDTWEYLNCGGLADRIDFFGANIMTFCKGSTYTDSGYNNATQSLSDYSLPIFLAAYGCSQALNRDFSEIKVLYGQQMSPVWSGGIIYEYFYQGPEPAYGLVSVSGAKVSLRTNFADVVTSLATVSPSRVASASYSPSNNGAATCPSGAATSLPPNPRTALASPSSTASGSSTNGTRNPATSSSPSQSGLSSGARARIGVGVAVVVLVAIAVALLFIRRRRQQKKTREDKPEQWTKTELAADDVDREARGHGPHMADSNARFEVEDTGRMQELPEHPPIFEIPGEGENVSEMAVSSPRSELPASSRC